MYIRHGTPTMVNNQWFYSSFDNEVTCNRLLVPMLNISIIRIKQNKTYFYT